MWESCFSPTAMLLQVAVIIWPSFSKFPDSFPATHTIPHSLSHPAAAIYLPAGKGKRRKVKGREERKKLLCSLPGQCHILTYTSKLVSALCALSQPGLLPMCPPWPAQHPKNFLDSHHPAMYPIWPMQYFLPTLCILADLPTHMSSQTCTPLCIPPDQYPINPLIPPVGRSHLHACWL